MVISHSYVSLPEGNYWLHSHFVDSSLPETFAFLQLQHTAATFWVDVHIYHLVIENIAMENRQNKWISMEVSICFNGKIIHNGPSIPWLCQS